MRKPGKHVMNVGVSALARETGLSISTVSEKLKRGLTADDIRAEAARKQGRTLPTKRRVPQKPTPSEYDMIVESRARFEALEEAKLRRQKALAERQELENMLRRGELLPVAYVRLWATRYITDGLDELKKGPSELADTLAAESDPLKTAVIVRNWLERAITKFHQLERLWSGGEEEKVA